MTTSSRFLVLVPVALGWMALTLLGGTWLGLDVARLDREAAIATALEDPALVAELREDALDAAFAALPEPAGALEALTRDLVDDSVASRWTITVAAHVLQDAGTGPVLPFALQTR